MLLRSRISVSASLSCPMFHTVNKKHENCHKRRRGMRLGFMTYQNCFPTFCFSVSNSSALSCDFSARLSISLLCCLTSCDCSSAAGADSLRILGFAPLVSLSLLAPFSLLFLEDDEEEEGVEEGSADPLGLPFEAGDSGPGCSRCSEALDPWAWGSSPLGSPLPEP